MSEQTSILPPNATPLERSMERAIAGAAPDLSPVATLMNPATCPQRLLAWLAWAMSVDEWEDDWSEEAKRETIRRSVAVHRRKGTIASIREAIRAAGLGEVEIIEGLQPEVLDGSFLLDGSVTLSGPDHWADYRVVLTRPITIDQAGSLRRILGQTAPARSRLKALDFTQAANRLDGSMRLDGTFSLGYA